MVSRTGDTAAIAGVIDRPRLYTVLDSQLIRVCVVQGPSGCGKTTLLRSWAFREEQNSPIVWVSLNSGVNNRQAFWQQVALSSMRPGNLPEETEEWLRSRFNQGDDPVAVAERVLREAGVLPLTMVLDAYEYLGDVMESIDEDLRRLILAVPSLRIIITSRVRTSLLDVDPPGGVVRLITLRDLALTAEETGQLIEAQTGISDRRLAESVSAATRGFPLTVRAIVLILSQLGSVPDAGSLEWNAVVTARLESLLPDAAAVQFVTDTSVPPYVDIELGELLSGDPEAKARLDMLERHGFGRWIPYARNRQVFQYVDTIRDTFRERAAQDRERFRRTCMATASWLLDNEEVIEQALQFAIDAEDYTLADRIFTLMVLSNPDTYTTDRFLPTLRTIPEEILPGYPMLAFGLALALGSNPILRVECPRIALIAAESTAAPSYIDPAMDTCIMAAVRAVALRLAGRYQDSCAACIEVFHCIMDLDPAIQKRFADNLATILRQLSYSIFMGGEINEAMAAANASVGLCPNSIGRNYSTVYVRGYSAIIGDLARATILTRSIDEEAWLPGDKLSYLGALGVVADSCAMLDSFDFVGAVIRLHDSDSYIQTAEFWPFLMTASVIARQGAGQGLAEARRVLAELFANVPHLGVGDNIATERLHGTLSLAFLNGGDRQTAATMLERLSLGNVHVAFARVSLLLAEGRDREALRLARRILQAKDHTIRTTAELQTIGAVAALRVGKSDEAWRWLNAAAVAWDTYGARMHVAMLAPRDRRALWEFARDRECQMLQRYLDIPASEKRANISAAGSLSKREQVVLEALAEQESIRAIADSLVVSPHTIKSQLQSIYRKLGVSSRQAALSVAHEIGLLD